MSKILEILKQRCVYSNNSLLTGRKIIFVSLLSYAGLKAHESALKRRNMEIEGESKGIFFKYFRRIVSYIKCFSMKHMH